jgi:VNT family MFS transporter (synaptic vesicle glycoprotein 2)
MLFKRIGLENPFANAFIYAAANLPGNLMTAVLMDRLGGRRILAISMLLSAACATGFAYANSSASGAAAIVLLASGFNAFSTAGWNAIDLMSTESFPTDVRTTGMGMLSASGRAGSVAAQFVNGYLIGPPVHVTLLLAITASMMLLGAVSSVLVRDYSNQTLPESLEAMRAEARAKRNKA